MQERRDELEKGEREERGQALLYHEKKGKKRTYFIQYSTNTIIEYYN
jgi:hypothetical protein